MKASKLFALFAIGLAFLNSHAQTEGHPVSIGIFGGAVDYAGELDGHSLFDFGDNSSFFVAGGELGLYVNKSLEFDVAVGFGDIGHDDEFNSFEGEFTSVDISLLYKLNNGKIFKEDAAVAPYLLLGGGVTDLRGDSTLISNNLVNQVSWGAGVRFPLSPRVALDIRNTYRYTGTDNLDLANEDMNDLYMTLTAGLRVNLGGKDTDGDGVQDKDDLCPETAGLEALMGCPDSDSDGVADKDDECPTISGTVMGCPDGDGDGVADKDDTCPSEAGITELAGCPDSDSDGIADQDDACPTIAGIIEFNGCVDSDGDGLGDNEDECPQVSGLPEMNGCPDQDGDGVKDADDRCPTEAGIASNKGCPEIDEEVEELFTQALTGVKFESGRDVIRTSSFGILNNVVKVMEDNPAYKLYVKGYTDSQGDDEMNLDLSQRRAKAVIAYLEDKGIQASRMRSNGYGEADPVATNDTAAGRAKNRRVEFSIEF